MRAGEERDAERTVVLPTLPPVHESWLPDEHPLYRPRHSRRQRVSLTVASLFFVLPVLLWLVGVHPGEIENRPLRPFPSFGQGWGFFTGLPEWATDRLSFRPAAIVAADVTSQTVFGEPASLGEHPVQGATAAGPSPDAGAGGYQHDPDLPLVENGGSGGAGYPAVIRGKDGWLYFGGEIQLKCDPQQPLDDLIGNIRRLREAVEASGRRFVLVVPPDKSTVLPEHLPDTYAGKECVTRLADGSWRRIAQAGAIDLRDELRAAGSAAYFPHDTHWTFVGGYLMTKAIAEQVRPGVTSRWQQTPGEPWSGTTDLSRMIGRPAVDSAQRFGLAPDGLSDRAKPYRSDFRSTLMIRSTTVVPGMITEPTFMVADSFAQFGTSYLAAAFETVVITHLENLQRNADAVIQHMVDSKVVVFEVVERNLLGGISPLSDSGVIDQISAAIAAHPVGHG